MKIIVYFAVIRKDRYFDIGEYIEIINKMLLNLSGKKILVTGIANNRSIAWGIAQQLSKAGAELGITYLPSDKGRFESQLR